MNKKSPLFFGLIFIWILCLPLIPYASESDSFSGVDVITYIPLGDSYSIGEGVLKEERWPNLLTRTLNKRNVPIRLIANPARTGWTVADVIQYELPYVRKEKPDWITLLIGVNDWVRGHGYKRFRKEYVDLLNRIEHSAKPDAKILLITIPDFSCSPTGKKWGYGRGAINGLKKFNALVESEGKRRTWPVADIFPLSQELCQKKGMFAKDGLHPSAQQYKGWVKKMLPSIDGWY